MAEIANEHKANLVIQKGAVIFAKDGFDITPEAMLRLDDRLPSVTVAQAKPVDTPAPGAAPPTKTDPGKGKGGPRTPPPSGQPQAGNQAPTLPPLDLQLRPSPQ